MFDEKTVDRFWSLADKSAGEDGCWPFDQTSFLAAPVGGYKRLWRPHRVAYILTYGPISDDMVVRHLCERRGQTNRCVNPKHLRKGTQQENTWDYAVRRLYIFDPGEIGGYEDVPDWIPPPSRKKR